MMFREIVAFDFENHTKCNVWAKFSFLNIEADDAHCDMTAESRNSGRVKETSIARLQENKSPAIAKQQSCKLVFRATESRDRRNNRRTVGSGVFYAVRPEAVPGTETGVNG
jgi:hypothetical protein